MIRYKWLVHIAIIYTLLSLISGCSWFNKQAKPPDNTKQDLTYIEKVRRPPLIFFDLESQIEDLFKPLNKMDFARAQEEYQKIRATWEIGKAEAGSIKGVDEADEAIKLLGSAIMAGKATESMSALNKFTNSLQDILTNYKLSPLSDIVNLATISRNISWELTDQDFKKALVRAEELKKTWEQSKVNLEQAGILSEVTKAHDAIGKIKGSVTAENKMASDAQIKKFDESMGKIRDFYKQKNESILP
jgi:hypothetical protein